MEELRHESSTHAWSQAKSHAIPTALEQVVNIAAVPEQEEVPSRPEEREAKRKTFQVISQDSVQRRVGVIDDDEGIRLYLSEVLSRQGFQVQDYASAEQFLVRLDQSLKTTAVFVMHAKVAATCIVSMNGSPKPRQTYGSRRKTRETNPGRHESGGEETGTWKFSDRSRAKM